MQTPATVALDQAGVAYRTVTYHVGDVGDGAGYGLDAASVLGLDPDTVGKTLVAELDDGRLVCAVVPVSGRLDLKALARAAGAKRATMADPARAERATGYVVGGIAPVGQKRPMATFVDELLSIADEIHVSGGRRGLEIAIEPAVLCAVLDAVVAPIAS